MSDTENHEALIRSFGPAHINVFSHAKCAEELRRRILARGEVIYPDSTETIPTIPYRDITHCDECGEAFQENDGPYVVFSVVSREEFDLWQKLKREDESAEPA